MFRRALPFARSVVSSRGFFGPNTPLQVLEEVGRAFGRLERELTSNRWDRAASWRPFVGFQHPTDTELFRMRNPIIEEDGVKKFKLEFDVRRFKPEDVQITTNQENSTLTIEAKYSDENSKFEYKRKISIPDGVDPKSITAKYTSEGSLVFEAPYVEPPKPEPPKEHVIEIKHN